MMTFPAITALCAGLLGFISFALASGAGFYRGKTGISIGDGGDKQLLLRMRRHGNFTEFTPLALILLGLLEMSGSAGSTALYILGGMLVVGRICHPIGLEIDSMNPPLRTVGAMLTIVMTLVCSGWLIYNYVMTM